MLLQPERINPELNQKGYNVKSDVWSLGITMVRQRACASTVMLGSVLGAPTLRWCVWLAAALPVGAAHSSQQEGEMLSVPKLLLLRMVPLPPARNGSLRKQLKSSGTGGQKEIPAAGSKGMLPGNTSAFQEAASLA